MLTYAHTVVHEPDGERGHERLDILNYTCAFTHSFILLLFIILVSYYSIVNDDEKRV